MEVGLNINDTLRIKLGDSFERITSTMDKEGIKYKIPYKGKDVKSDNMNEQSIVMFLETFGAELNILNDKIIYIKSYDLKSNTLFDITEHKGTIEILRAIINEISKLFEVPERNITVETFDSKKYTTVLKLKIDATHTVRVGILCNSQNKAHINTVRLIMK